MSHELFFSEFSMFFAISAQFLHPGIYCVATANECIVNSLKSLSLYSPTSLLYEVALLFIRVI